MSSVSFSTSSSSAFSNYSDKKLDIISFIGCSTDSCKYVELLESIGYKGLLKKDEMDELLQKEEYRAILSHLWTEINLDIRIEWLETAAKKGSPLMMLELSKTMVKKYNKEDPDLLQKIIHWYLLGMHCAHLDAACHYGITSEQSVNVIHVKYGLLLGELKLKPEQIKTLLFEHGLNILTTWKPSVSNPSPKWLSISSLDTIAHETEWLKRRTEAHEKLLSKLIG